jgi:hypothetical protein
MVMLYLQYVAVHSWLGPFHALLVLSQVCLLSRQSEDVLLLLLLCRVISLCIVQSDVFTQDHQSLAYTNGAQYSAHCSAVLVLHWPCCVFACNSAVHACITLCSSAAFVCFVNC